VRKIIADFLRIVLVVLMMKLLAVLILKRFADLQLIILAFKFTPKDKRIKLFGDELFWTI
jgi:hypothetical protein